MSVENLIKSAIEKNAGEFESTFSNVMAAKMSAAIETKYEAPFLMPAVPTPQCGYH